MRDEHGSRRKTGRKQQIRKKNRENSNVSAFLFDSIYQIITWVCIAGSFVAGSYFLSKDNMRGTYWSGIALAICIALMIAMLGDRHFFQTSTPPSPVPRPTPPGPPADRPWLSVADVTPIGPLVFREGGVDLTIKFIIKNIGGRSPANGVTIKAEIIFPPMKDYPTAPLKRQKEICEKITYDKGVTVFDQPQVFTDHFVMSRDEMEVQNANIKTAGMDKHAMPILVGCVCYNFGGSFEGETGFIYEVMHAPSADIPNAPFAILIGENVPVDKIILRKFILGGDYAK